MRLQKYIAASGLASRRKAEEMIAGGSVRVNGKVTTEMGVQITESDVVEVDGAVAVPVSEKIYIMLNKPAGYITTVKDQFGRPSVMDLIKGVNTRIFPVGRLDYDTSGLLILTNDGDFAYWMTHPSNMIRKTYIAEIDGILSEEKLSMLRKGLMLEGRMTAPAEITVSEPGGNSKSTIAEITIHEGRNRQVRRMFEAVGHPVLKLKRVSVGSLRLDGLGEGRWRTITKEEAKICRSLHGT